MLILGIETSTKVCAVALADDKGLVAESRLNIKNIHAQKLHLMVDDLFATADLNLNDLDGIAVSIGPGSFTGLRIGLAAAKGLALPTDIPITAVPTLKAIAHKAPIMDGKVAALLRARKNEYYYALFERNHLINELVKDVTIITLDDIAKEIPKDALLIGHTDELGTILPNKTTPEQFSLPDAFTIAKIGLEHIRNNNIQPIDTIEPVYHQNFIAGKPKSPVISFDQ